VRVGRPSVVWLCGLERWMESSTRLGGFRALKKTPEAPYTTKVNTRDHTQPWNHPPPLTATLKVLLLAGAAERGPLSRFVFSISCPTTYVYEKTEKRTLCGHFEHTPAVEQPWHFMKTLHLPPLDRPSAPCDRRASVATGKTELVARAPSAFERAATERGSPFRPRACLSAPASRSSADRARRGSLSRARSNAARRSPCPRFSQRLPYELHKVAASTSTGGSRKVGPEAARSPERAMFPAAAPTRMPLHYQNHLLRRVRLKETHAC
jgi:hypothetical protein